MGAFQASILDAFNKVSEQQEQFDEQMSASASKPPLGPLMRVTRDLSSDLRASLSQVSALPSRPLDPYRPSKDNEVEFVGSLFLLTTLELLIFEFIHQGITSFEAINNQSRERS